MLPWLVKYFGTSGMGGYSSGWIICRTLSRVEISNISSVPWIKDNVGSQSHHPFGHVDIPEKTKQKLENNECLCEGRAMSLVSA